MSGEGSAGGGAGQGAAAQAFSGGGAPPPAPNGDGGGHGPRQAAQVPDWASSYDDDTKAWVASKGFKDPKDALSSYRNLEKVYGADKAGRAVIRPADPNDRAAQEAFYKALGRPDSPEGYGIAAPDGQDPKLAQSLAAALHSAGLTAEQGKAVSQWLGSTSAEERQAEETERSTRNQAEFDSLKSEWGKDYDAKVQLGARAAKAAAIPGEVLDKIENAIGTAATFRLMAAVGDLLREDAGVGATAGGSAGGGSPEAVQERINALRADPEFDKRLSSSDYLVREKAQNELSELYKLRYAPA